MKTTLSLMVLGTLLLGSACQEDAGAPPYVDETVQTPAPAAPAQGGGDEEGAPGLPGPDPYKAGEARLGFGLFYEGQASERLAVDNATVFFYIYEGTFVLEADSDRQEGLQSDRITLAGKPWWGGGIHFATGQSRDLSLWKSMHLSVKSKVPVADLEIKVKAAGTELGTKLATVGYVPDSAWHEVTIDLAKLAASGLDLTKVEAPFILVGGSSAQGDQLWVDNLYLTQD